MIRASFDPQRQRERIALAKQRGVYRGRKKSLSPKRVAELRQRVASGETKVRVVRDFGISRETLYNYLAKADRDVVRAAYANPRRVAVATATAA